VKLVLRQPADWGTGIQYLINGMQTRLTAFADPPVGG